MLVLGAVFITEYFDSTKDENGNICNPLISTTATDFDRAEAQKHGWRLIKGSEQGFRSHGYCSTDKWIVGLTESIASQGDGNGTLHSTTRGNTFQAGLVVKRMRVEFYANGRTRQPAP